MHKAGWSKRFRRTAFVDKRQMNGRFCAADSAAAPMFSEA
jgi:hypothetical protein